MTATKERDLKHQLTEAVPGSLAIRGGGSLGVDVVWCIPNQPSVVFEVKATSDVNFYTADSQRVKDQWDQYTLMAQNGNDVRYAVWFKRDGWRFYTVHDYLAQGYPVLRRDEGLTWPVFIQTFSTNLRETHDDRR